MTAIDINLFCIWHGRSEKHSDKWYGCICYKVVYNNMFFDQDTTNKKHGHKNI